MTPYNILNIIFSPGALGTELNYSVKAAEGIKAYYEVMAIDPDSFVRAVLFAINQPDDVDINKILFRPTTHQD